MNTPKKWDAKFWLKKYIRCCLVETHTASMNKHLGEHTGIYTRSYSVTHIAVVMWLYILWTWVKCLHIFHICVPVCLLCHVSSGFRVRLKARQSRIKAVCPWGWYFEAKSSLMGRENAGWSSCTVRNGLYFEFPLKAKTLEPFCPSEASPTIQHNTPCRRGIQKTQWGSSVGAASPMDCQE